MKWILGLILVIGFVILMSRDQNSTVQPNEIIVYDDDNSSINLQPDCVVVQGYSDDDLECTFKSE